MKAEHVAEKNGTRFFYLDWVVYFALWRCTLKSSARLITRESSDQTDTTLKSFYNSPYKNEIAYKLFTS